MGTIYPDCSGQDSGGGFRWGPISSLGNRLWLPERIKPSEWMSHTCLPSEAKVRARHHEWNTRHRDRPKSEPLSFCQPPRPHPGRGRDLARLGRPLMSLNQVSINQPSKPLLPSPASGRTRVPPTLLSPLLLNSLPPRTPSQAPLTHLPRQGQH